MNSLRKVTPAGVVTTLAGLAGSSGSADGTNSNARFNVPDQLTVDSTTNIYVATDGDHTIRKMTPAGDNWVVTTLAGVAGRSGRADGMNSDARFNAPFGVALDSAGNLYVVVNSSVILPDRFYATFTDVQASNWDLRWCDLWLICAGVRHRRSADQDTGRDRVAAW